MSSEAEIQAEIWKAIGSRPDTRLFRNNQGIATHAGGQRVKYGLANPGGSDLIGLHAVTITPDMVGQTLAVFTALEIKTPTGAIRPEQRTFIEFVRSFGGKAGIVRSVADAEAVLR